MFTFAKGTIRAVKKQLLRNRKMLIGGLAILLPGLILGLIFIPGIDKTQLKNRPSFASIDLAESEITKQEQNFLKMRPDNEKKFFFFAQDKFAELGLVYIPGFSATRREISPVIENLAQQLKASLFMTRFAGHGQSGDEFANIKAEDFLSDGLEALQVSRVLGKKKIWIGTSTGALAALWVAANFPNEIDSLILVSPAFDLKPAQSRFLAGYLGPLVIKVLVGPYREWTPVSPEQKKYWHTRYRAESLTALTRLVSWNHEINLAKLKIPVLILYTPFDDVVEVSSIIKKFNELGSKKKSLLSIPSKNHVLAGAITSPETTELVTQEMLKWIQGLNSKE